MTTGCITSTATNIVRLAAGSSATASSASFVRGPVVAAVAASGTTTVVFPIGKLDDYRPVTLSVTHTNATSVDYTAEMKNSNAQSFGYTLPSTITHVSLARYYTVTRQSVSNLTSATIKLTYGVDDGVSNQANLRVVKTIGTNNQWYDMGGVGTAATTGTITSNTFNSFSTFTLGNATGGSNVLPVQLAAFTATRNGADVTLSWTTESELNTSHFDVERSSDGRSFDALATVNAAGTSYHRLDYHTVDRQPLSGVSYYRLRMVDNDGSFQYSDIRAVTFEETINVVLTAYPNPVVDGQLHIGGSLGTQTSYALCDVAGRVCKSGTIAVNDGITTLDVSDLNSGIYTLLLYSDATKQSLRVVVQR